MGLLAPAALALSATLLAVLAMHMLRLRRRVRRVPSTYLWRSILEDPPANRPWQPPRPSLLLLLQLVALALLVAALARPYLPSDQPAGDVLVLLLDRSASMAATDVSPSRLEAAKARLLEAVDGSSGALVTIIAFDDSMEVLASGETDHAIIRQAVAAVQPRPVTGRIADAISFATTYARGVDARVAIYTDGTFAVQPGELPPGTHIEIVGRSSENQAVSALSLSAGIDSLPDVFVQVANHSPVPVTRRVEISVDGDLVDARDMRLPAHGRDSFTLNLAGPAAVATARLAGEDSLSLDDVAWSVLPGGGGAARVTLVGGGNRFLETALGLLPNVDAVRKVGLEDAGGPFGLTDVTILDGVIPPVLPPGNLLLVSPPRSLGAADGVSAAESIELAGVLEGPVARAIDESGLAAGAEFDQVAILEAAALRLGAGWETVVEAHVGEEHWPLLATGTLQGRPAIVLAFDLRQSDLPLRPAFPLVLGRSIELLSPSTLAGVPASVAAGEPVTLQLSPRARRLTLVGPDGSPRVLPLDPSGVRYADTDALGVYQLEVETDAGVETGAFAVNMFAAAESDVRPRRVAVPEPNEGGSGSGEEEVHGRSELWWPLGLTALAVVGLEWVTYHRSALKRSTGG